jgi:hypothetical protein
MKKILLSVFAVLSVTFAFAQKYTDKLVLASGNKITTETSVTTEASVMGMEMNNTTSSKAVIEVKSSTDKNYTVTNTTTYMKTDMNMMGQSMNYDSDKPEAGNADVAKAIGEKINKPVELLLDAKTGDAMRTTKKEKSKDSDEGLPMDGLLSVAGENTDEGFVSSAFQLIPEGKKVGDSWSDSTITKDSKVVRNFTLKNIDANIATIGLVATGNLTTKLEVQGMEIEMKSNTTTTGDIITDITTGRVKKKTSVKEINGSMQLMGQDMPVTAKATSSNIYN